MSADEFIHQYGKVEVEKMLHNEKVMEQMAAEKERAKTAGIQLDTNGRPRQSGLYGSPIRMSLVGQNAMSMIEMKKLM